MIKILTLCNFKCFEDLKLSFGNLTLLTGLNGSGKSSVIQALLILRQTYLTGYMQEHGLLLNGELVSVGTGKDVLYENADTDSVIIGLTTDQGDYDWTFDYFQDSDLLLLQAEQNRLSSNLGQLTSNLFTWPFQYIKADRIGPKTAYPISRHRGTHQVDLQADETYNYFLGTQGEYAPHFLSAFGDRKIPIPALRHPAETSLRFDYQTSAWMQEISPGVHIRPTTFSNMDVVNLQYSFERQGEVSNEFRAANVGFGITYTLPIVLALLTARPGSLIILENPEAHLHPRGQSHMAKLISLATANGVQVIVETHSDHVLNGVRVAVHEGTLSPETVRFHFFRSSQEAGASSRVESPQIDRNGRLDFWPEGFFDEMDRSLEILLMPAGDVHADRPHSK